MMTLLIAIAALSQTPGFKFQPEDTVVTTESGLQFADLKLGTGEALVTGQTPVVHYVLHLDDGTEVDSSRKEGRTPFRFTIGRGEVIKGWEEGLIGMKAGGTRKLRIPYQIAYGEAGRPPVIPERATLWFTVELLSITEPAKFGKTDKVVKTDDGLQFADLVEGKGDSVKDGDQVTLHYYLYNESAILLDTSLQPGRKELSFRVGDERLIRGFSLGLIGMKPGGTRKLRIPAELGYGDKGSGPVRPGETLWFTVELIKIGA